MSSEGSVYGFNPYPYVKKALTNKLKEFTMNVCVQRLKYTFTTCLL